LFVEKNIISLNDRDYLKTLINYNKILSQRNSLLKYFAANHTFDALNIEVYNEQLITYGEELFIGNSELKVIHLPGHSEGSVFFYNVENKIAVVGDILFNGSIGRTDLPGGNLDDLLTGIHKKLLVLPEDTQIFPGHGPETSIGIEAKTNPFLDNQVL